MALLRAAWDGHADVARYLIQKGEVDVNTVDGVSDR